MDLQGQSFDCLIVTLFKPYFTSRYLRKEFPQIKDAYRKPVLWTASYFVATCGGVTIEQLKKYVQNQSRPTK